MKTVKRAQRICASRSPSDHGDFETARKRLLRKCETGKKLELKLLCVCSLFPLTRDCFEPSQVKKGGGGGEGGGGGFQKPV